MASLNERLGGLLDWRWWRNAIVNGIVLTLVGFGLILLIGVIFGPWFERPPITLVSRNPSYLGVVCPGDVQDIHNIVTVDEPVVVVYYISVMDASGIFNRPGHQVVLSGYQHPVPARFEQHIDWQVPQLPPGLYTRSFAARGTDTSESTVFVTSRFLVAEPTACEMREG